MANRPKVSAGASFGSCSVFCVQSNLPQLPLSDCGGEQEDWAGQVDLHPCLMMKHTQRSALLSIDCENHAQKWKSRANCDSNPLGDLLKNIL